MLGLGRPPEVRYRAVEGISPRLQRLLDTFEVSPALVRTAAWDIVAWNRAATVVMTDYGKLAPEDRNVLRMLFCNPSVRNVQHDWETVARFVVGAFRADAARAGLLRRLPNWSRNSAVASPEFKAIWQENEVIAHGEGTKRLRHPVLGDIELEYSGFAIDGRPDLNMVVYNPVDPDVVERIRRLVREKNGRP